MLSLLYLIGNLHGRNHLFNSLLIGIIVPSVTRGRLYSTDPSDWKREVNKMNKNGTGVEGGEKVVQSGETDPRRTRQESMGHFRACCFSNCRSRTITEL